MQITHHLSSPPFSKGMLSALENEIHDESSAPSHQEELYIPFSVSLGCAR